MHFAMPMILREPINYVDAVISVMNLLFLDRCSIWFYQKNKHKIRYSNLDLAILQVPNSTEIHVSIFVKFKYCDEFLFRVRSRSCA